MTYSQKCLMFFNIRAMRTKMNLDPDTGLVTQYSASQPEVSYASTWKCRVSNILSGLTQINWMAHVPSSDSVPKQAEV